MPCTGETTLRNHDVIRVDAFFLKEVSQYLHYRQANIHDIDRIRIKLFLKAVLFITGNENFNFFCETQTHS